MILFCEYVIPEKYRETFQAWAEARRQLWSGAELMENAGQPGVFVEIWPVRDEREGLRIQKERLGGRSGWSEMEQWVKGGRDGIRSWMFRPLFPDELPA